MKRLLDAFGHWGFFALYAVLLFVAAFWIGVKIDAFFLPMRSRSPCLNITGWKISPWQT